MLSVHNCQVFLLVMPVLWLQLPHVLVRILNVVVADLLENLLEISRRLSRLSDQVLDVVILMLLEQGEQNFLNLAYIKNLRL